MVALFVSLMFIGFILADVILQKIEARSAIRAAYRAAAAGELASWVAVPEGVRLSPGHSWAMPLQEGTVRAGVDSLVANAVGKVHRVQLPLVGEWIEAGKPLARLAFNGTALSVSSPVSGRVSAVNHGLHEHPENVASDPYGKGWICSIDQAQPRHHALHSGRKAALWLECELDRFREFLSARLTPQFAVEPTSQDAGVPMPGALGQLGADAWVAFERDFTQVR